MTKIISLWGNSAVNEIDGGKGQDIVQLRGDFEQYKISNEDDKIIVEDTIDARDGKLILRNIQVLRFTDKDIVYEIPTSFNEETQ